MPMQDSVLEDVRSVNVPTPDSAATDWRPNGYRVWLERELRSDHAGESGAVEIYRGILAVSRDPDVRKFARRHRQTEQRHLKLISSMLPSRQRSRFLPLWHVAGFITGALPALFNPTAVYATIEAVETFVDKHYQQQIDKLVDGSLEDDIRATLDECRRDEVLHRDEARQARRSNPGMLLRAWLWAVAKGSALAVGVARRV